MRWKFQQTFEAPREDVRLFVKTVYKALPEMERADLTIHNVVFEPKHLTALLTSHSLPRHYERDTTITASEGSEAEALLQAALTDWVDFLFVLHPKPFVIYADHHKYTTFHAQTRSNLNRVTRLLSRHGFREIAGFVRRF